MRRNRFPWPRPPLIARGLLLSAITATACAPVSPDADRGDAPADAASVPMAAAAAPPHPVRPCSIDVAYLDARGAVRRRERADLHTLVKTALGADPAWTQVMVRPDQRERGWVDTRAFDAGYAACLASATKARAALHANPCKVTWLHFDSQGDPNNWDEIDIRATITPDGRPSSLANVRTLAPQQGFIVLRERATHSPAWFPQAHVLAVLEQLPMCASPDTEDGAPQGDAGRAESHTPAEDASTAAALDAAGTDSAGTGAADARDVTLRCTFPGGQTLFVRTDEAGAAVFVRGGVEQGWTTYRDGQRRAAPAPTLDRVLVDAATIHVARLPEQDDAGREPLFTVAIDRRTGAVVSEGAGSAFPPRGAGSCTPI